LGFRIVWASDSGYNFCSVIERGLIMAPLIAELYQYFPTFCRGAIVGLVVGALLAEWIRKKP